ncbi:MAG: hypothetical protein IIC49_06685, partial [Planctomycetes bacterium]|nr:hypothetical protein [Planctomycetota bacterium]
MSDRASHTWLPAPPPILLPTALFLVAASALILGGFERGRGAADQINYHEPVIRTFADQWPGFDFSDYLSATTPAYHVALATFARFVADSRPALQFAGALFTIGLLLTLTLAGSCGQRIGQQRALSQPLEARRWNRAVLLTLPVTASLYVFSSGVWLLPDNAAWWGVLVIVLLALRSDFGITQLLWSGLILTLLVATRQIHLWAAAVVWAAAWIGPTRGDDTLTSWTDLLRDLPVRMRRTLVAVAVTLPAFGVVYAFVRLWGGLSPPTFQEDAQGLNPAAPAFIMAQVGLFSLFFAGWLIGPARELVTKRRSTLLLAVGAGLVIALVPATSYSIDAGRFSGLWNAAHATPLVFGRVSPLIVVLAVGGVVASVAWFLALPLRTRWIGLAALVAFIAAQTASHNCWQRYHEPFILILMAVLARDLDPNDAPSTPHRVGPRVGRFSRIGGPLA